MGFLQDVRDELRADYSGRKVRIKLGPLGEIEFERNEFLSLWAIQDHLAEIINKTFSERLVMHGDMKKEQPAYCIESLMAAASALDQKRDELRQVLPPDRRRILTVLEDLRTECTTCAKSIRNTNAEMDAGNEGESDSEFKVRPSDWLPDLIRAFRVRTYPGFRLLIEVLPDGNAKDRAEHLWFEGLNALTNQEKLSTQPTARVLS